MSPKRPTIYPIDPGQTTDLEPAPGYYVGSFFDGDEPHGPFNSRMDAEDWREAEMGRRLDLMCA